MATVMTATCPECEAGLEQYCDATVYTYNGHDRHTGKVTYGGYSNQIVVDETPLQIYMDMIVHRLRESSPLEFTAFFTSPLQRSRLVGLFLAVLELIRARQICVDQRP